MSKDATSQVGEDKKSQEGEKEEVSALMQEALDMGYNPEWDGPEDEYKTHGEFVRTAKLYKDITQAKQHARRAETKYKSLQDSVQKIAKMQSEFLKAQNDKQIQALKAAKSRALREQDFDAVEQYESQLDEVNKLNVEEVKVKDEEDNAPTKEDYREYYEEVWIDNNKWYKTDLALQEEANDVIKSYMATHPTAQPEELFTHITTAMKSKVRQKSQEGPKKKGGQVEGATRTTTARRTASRTLSDLPEDARDMAKNMIDLKVSLGIKRDEAEKQVFAKLGEK